MRRKQFFFSTEVLIVSNIFQSKIYLRVESHGQIYGHFGNNQR